MSERTEQDESGAAAPADASGLSAVARRQRSLLDKTERPFVERLHGLDAFAFLFDRYAEKVAERGADEAAGAEAKFLADLDAMGGDWSDAVWTLVERGGRPSRMAGRMFLATAIDAHHRGGAEPGSMANNLGLLRAMLGAGTGFGRIAIPSASAGKRGKLATERVGRLLNLRPDLNGAEFEAVVRPRIEAAMTAELTEPLIPDFVTGKAGQGSAKSVDQGNVDDSNVEENNDLAEPGDDVVAPSILADQLRQMAKRAAFEAALTGWVAAAIACQQQGLHRDAEAWSAAAADVMRRSYGPVATLERAFANRPLFPLSASSWWSNGAFAPTLLILATG